MYLMIFLMIILPSCYEDNIKSSEFNSHEIVCQKSFSSIVESIWNKKKKGNYFKPEIYIFLGHTYAEKYKVDKRIANFRLTNHHFWLGGDIYQNTSNSTYMLEYINYLFDIKSPETHWAIGNHDFHKSYLPIEKFTGKSQYYAVNVNGITLIVMNSNLYSPEMPCEAKVKQTNYINSVLDTIQSSSHVILMSHHIFWGGMNEDERPVLSYANTDFSDKLFNCDFKENAKKALLPKLKSVLEKDVKVIFLSGDMGQKQSAYEYVNEDGMVFLGSGILSDILYNNEKFPKAGEEDSILVFSHYPEKRVLKWKFVNIGN